MQAVEASKMARGNVSSFLKGTGKSTDGNLTAQQDLSASFKQMIDDVERNHATRVGMGWAHTTATTQSSLLVLPTSLSLRSSTPPTSKW